MPELGATLLAILVMAVATYLTRIAGYYLGGYIAQDSLAGQVLDVLPGAALSGVLALSLVQLPAMDMLAVAAAVAVFMLSGRTLAGIATGLVIAVGNAHLLA